MKKLTLSEKASGVNYFFGQPTAKGQNLVCIFNSPEELHTFMSTTNSNGMKVNCSYIHKVINAEYSRSRTYYSRSQFNSLDFCKKVFEKHATEI